MRYRRRTRPVRSTPIYYISLAPPRRVGHCIQEKLFQTLIEDLDMLRPKRCEGAGEAFAVVGHVDAHDAAALLDPADTRIPHDPVEDRRLFKDRLDDLFARFQRIEVTFEDQPAAFDDCQPVGSTLDLRDLMR